MEGVYVLTRKQIEWAWKMRCDGHPMWQIADALSVGTRTVERHLKRVYGRSKPIVLNELKYEE